jgi:hypothetical protein
MKNLFLLVCFCLAGVFLVPASAQESPVIYIVNNTGYTGYYLYISQIDSDDWEEDVLEEDILPDGEMVIVKLLHPLSQVNRYDIRLEDEDDDSYTKWNVLITPNARIEFTLDDLD